MERYFIVLSKDQSNPLPFGPPLWKFLTYAAAEEQARTWAKAHPDKQFVILQPITEEMADDRWHEGAGDHSPNRRNFLGY